MGSYRAGSNEGTLLLVVLAVSLVSVESQLFRLGLAVPCRDDGLLVRRIIDNPNPTALVV